jgi:hypothetical protein
MRIPGADQAIGNLIKWSEKDEWAPSTISRLTA